MSGMLRPMSHLRLLHCLVRLLNNMQTAAETEKHAKGQLCLLDTDVACSIPSLTCKPHTIVLQQHIIESCSISCKFLSPEADICVVCAECG